ncbi:alpha/beta hydrolase [Baekduia soli]|uniref:alpha/beta hydrolase n=1 Tax=Baekduia soli TaxID=496014 RepID=UPI0016529996|nr:alpha/beta hydrolase [Baekduia soli]
MAGGPSDDPLAGIHPQVRSLLEAAGTADTLPGPADIVAARAAYLQSTLQFGGSAEPVAEVRAIVVPHGDIRLPAALYVPQHAPEADGLVVWLHGGGWYLGDIPTFDRVGRSLANASGMKVLLVEYRLAPEHAHPDPVQDADAVVAWARSKAAARQLAIDPARVVVGGDSAGGQLAAAAVHHARGDGLAPIAAQLLVYPALDPAMDSESYRAFAEGPMLTAADMQGCWEAYLRGAPAEGDDLRMLEHGDHAGVPPAWIAVAGHDPLRDDGLRYAAALRAAGVEVHENVFEDMVHGFLRFGGVVDRTGELIRWLGDAARTTTTAAS